MTLKIFRTDYYNIDKTPIVNLSKKIDSDIRNSYFGGIVDVYIPVLKDGYYYDINSLYPYAMLNDMPIGKPKFIKGKIDLANLFGFVYVEVTSPNDMFIPFIPVKHNNKTIIPLGTWKGWYFSEELKYAESLGYKIKPLGYAYEFEKGKPFNEFVNHFYDIKKNSTTPAERTLAKLFLNSLYGKFGLSDMVYEIKVLDANESLNLIKNDNHIEAIIEPDELDSNLGLYLIKYHDKKPSFHNVAIASAITAYSRIEIDKYKRIPDNKCYYSDTDSVFLEKPLDYNLINNEIGGMKLEDNIKYAVFLGSKTYGYINNDNKEVIKIKGFNSNKMNFDKLTLLLDPNMSFNINSEIFKRTSTNINILNLTKKLKNTIINKRNIIIKNNKIFNTYPFKIFLLELRFT